MDIVAMTKKEQNFQILMYIQFQNFIKYGDILEIL